MKTSLSNLFQALSQRTQGVFQASHSSGKRPRTKRGNRLVVELLEDRLVLTTMSDVPFAQPYGPTNLAINFDGENFYGKGISANGNNGKVMEAYIPTTGSKGFAVYGDALGANQDQGIQDTLIRVSELYAPFDVEVQRKVGPGNYLGWRGSTTVFVGQSIGTDNTGPGTTPAEYVDYPVQDNAHWNGRGDHIRNSDQYDLAFVDASQNQNGAIPAVATAIAHEAGHTFGLAHVRTDGLSGDTPLQQKNGSSVPDVMSYINSPGNLRYFAHDGLPLTGWNFDNGFKLQDDTQLPNYQSKGSMSVKPDTQDSWYCLYQVLGGRPFDPNDTHFHVADAGAIDWRDQSTYVHPNRDDVPNTESVFDFQGTITRLGDYDVFEWTAPASETIAVNSTGQNGLSPLLLVYDNNGSMQWNKSGGSQPLNATDTVKNDSGNNLVYIWDSYGGRSQSLFLQPNTFAVTQGQSQGDCTISHVPKSTFSR
jgi:hypothetical protein